MIVKDVVNYALSSDVSQLDIANFNTDKHERDMLSFINLGVIELAKRFSLYIKTECIDTVSFNNVYELTNSDVSSVLAVYNSNGNELTVKSNTGETVKDYDMVQLSYKTFLLNEPTKCDRVTFVYKASPKLIVDLEDNIDIPQDMLEALLHYIGYRAYASLDPSIQGDNNTHYMRFEKSCKSLEDLGYGTSNDSVINSSVSDRGFV